jgi:outer membrane receptor protein involved in Fe transport
MLFSHLYDHLTGSCATNWWLIEKRSIHMRHPGIVAVLLLASVGMGRTGNAQVTTGTILGTVTDQSGGVLAGAMITATNLDTGFSRAVRTDTGGTYVLANMPLGRYDVQAEAQSFKTKKVGPSVLVVDQRLRIDIMLELGAVAETMEVKGAATLLQTDQPDVNQIVQEKEITGLPLNGRDFFSLLLLSNGVQDTSNDQGGATTNVTFSVNGMRPEANSVTLDGVQMSSVREADVDLRPNVDAIQEFKVLTSIPSAEYGHTAGGVISIQTKSGTNVLRGTLFEFHRNDALNASNFFRNPVNPKKAPLKQNHFGGTLGGPLRRGKTFFFGDYQGYTLRKINEAFARVPEVAFRRGDFSSLLPGAVVMDPETGLPFPGNIIPAQRIHPLASAMINAVALPNLPNDYPLGNYFVQQPHRVTTHEGGLRIDHTLSANDQLFVRFRLSNSHLFTADAMSRPDGPMPGLAKGTNDDGRGIVQGGTHDDRNYNTVVSYVRVLGPKLVSDSRVGLHSYNLDVLSNAHGQNLAEKFGLRGTNVDENSSGLPILYLNAYTNFGGDDFKPLYFKETFWQFNQTFTYSSGGHTLKTGGELRTRKEDHYFALFPAGAFYYYPQRTTNYTYVGSHELAEVLLGLPMFSFHGRRFGSPVLRDNQYSAFAQDDWKISDRLTLNLGVRYEYYTPFYSPTNELSMFDVDLKRIVIAGKDGESRYIVDTDRNDFAPRVGAVYKLDKRTTLRGGFGVFYTPETAKRDDIKFNPPFYREYTLFDQWMWFDAAPPAFEDPGPFPTGYNTTNIERAYRRGYSQQYSVAAQRELPGGLLAEVGYVGSRAEGLPFSVNINQPHPDGTPAPFPDLGRTSVVRPTATSSYHSGQFKLEKRFGQGLFLLATHTWSKSIDTVSSAMFSAQTNGGVQNIFEPEQNRAVSDWDVPHRFAISSVWDVPFGKDRRFGATAPRAARALLGDWQLTGIFIARSGMPGTVTVGVPGSPGNAVPGGDARPNLLHDPNLDSSQRSIDQWFDTTAFAAARSASGGLLPGDAGRNIIRGPGYVNLDLGFLKHVPSGGQSRVQFRIEIFNALNQPHFALPVLRMSDPAFGKITHTRSSTNFGSTATSFGNRMIQVAVKYEF